MSGNEDKLASSRLETKGVAHGKAINPVALISPTRATSIFRRTKSVDQTKLQEPAVKKAAYYDRR